jgi:hypothetical protein
MDDGARREGVTEKFREPGESGRGRMIFASLEAGSSRGMAAHLQAQPGSKSPSSDQFSEHWERGDWVHDLDVSYEFAYSPSPAASRASAISLNSSTRETLPSRNV